MKCKTKLSPSKAEPGKVLQIRKGETTITLRDADGHEEVYHDRNMQTNAINEMLRNCGWLNRDNLDQTNLATQLLGGVLLYHDAITEDATVVVAPAGIPACAVSLSRAIFSRTALYLSPPVTVTLVIAFSCP